MTNGRPPWHERLKVTLWTLIVPPAVWAAHFLFAYLWAAISCAKVGEFARFPTLFAAGTLAALLVIAGSGWIAWKQQKAPDDPPPHDDATQTDRLHFLAKSTLLLAWLSIVGVIFTALPVVFLRECT